MIAKTGLSAPYFSGEEKSREYLEKIRWPNGSVCPHCGSIDEHYLLNGKKTMVGLYKCSDCRKQFTLTVGTLFERSRIPLHKWLTAVYLLCASKKGMSSHQLHRMLGITYKTAWFMAHRIREAIKDPALQRYFKCHDKVKHSKGEYVRGRSYTYTVENFFSILKRGLTGSYQHVGANHLKRYIGEFDFRYNNRKIADDERAAKALRGIEGKRLMYRDLSEKSLIQ